MPMKLSANLARDFQDARELLRTKWDGPAVVARRRQIDSMAEFSSEAGADRLERLLSTARLRVPRYGDLNETENIKLSDFPLTYKADLRADFADSISRTPTGEMEPGRYVISQTSGSTGQPVPVLSTAETGGVSNAVIYERLHRVLDLPKTGTAISVGLHRAGTSLIQTRLFPRPYVIWNLRGFHPGSPDIAADYDAVVGKFDVDRITGTSSRLVALANYCRQRGIRLRPKAVVASFEHMPESGRDLVEDTFGCTVTMLYVTAETGYAAWECSQHKLHFQTDLVAPEIVHKDGPDGVGQVVLTALMSLPMPIIRYVTGDMAPDLSSCDCGLPGSVTTGLLGRARTSLIAADGSLYSPYALLAALSAAGLPDFQIVQSETGVLELLTPMSSDATDLVVADINRRLLDSLGPQEGFQLRVASSRPFIRTASGKRNPVIQHLDIPLAPERTGYINS